jgi:hypothetical protein
MECGDLSPLFFGGGLTLPISPNAIFVSTAATGRIRPKR